MAAAKKEVKQTTLDDVAELSKKDTTEGEIVVVETEATGAADSDETALATTTATELAGPEGFITDPDQFLMQAEHDDEDTIESLPRLRIDQKSKDNAGELFCEDMAQHWEEMNLVLLRKTSSRILWPETFDKNNKALCKSHDGKTPEAEDKDNDTYEAKANTCDDCPLSKWATVEGKRIAPKCSEVLDLMVVDTTLMIPFFFSLSALGLSAGKKSLIKPMKLRTMSLKAKRKQAGLSPAHYCMFSFKLSTRYDERDSGNSYQPVFSDIEELSDDDKAMFVQVAIGCQSFSPHTKPAGQDEYGSGGGSAKNGGENTGDAFKEKDDF